MATDNMGIRLQLSIATLCGALLASHVASAAAASEPELVAAARAAGTEASARVFQETTPTNPADSERERPVVSGKAVLIGAAMVSAAIVAAAFILRDRCEPAERGLFLEIPRYDPPPAPEGRPLPAAPPLPPLPLPELCVPR